MATNIGSLDGPDVVDLTVPSSGGTAAGSFKVEVEVDPEVDDAYWPWPAEWPVTSD
jgi:hypothetical protein